MRMTTAEHLIENALSVYFEAERKNEDVYEAFEDAMQNGVNAGMLETSGITQDELWYITQYVAVNADDILRKFADLYWKR